MDATGYVGGQESAPHFLGAFFEGPINGRKIEGIRELGGDEYRQYVHDAATVLGFFSDYEQYVMVRHAYVEYLNLLERQAAALANHVHMSEVMRYQIVHNINRKLRSFFSEFRAFLDYTETKLKRRYGQDSDQVAAFKAARSRRFDDSFAYRFVYKLRNYALHVDLPLNAMSLASGEGKFDAGDLGTHNRFSVRVARDTLLNDGFDWGRHVRPGLEDLSPSFELNPIIKEAMYCLEEIHVELVCSKLAEEKRAAESVLTLAGKVPEPAIPCVLRFGGPEEDIINGYTLHMEREEGSEGSGADHMAVHIGWMPIGSARIVLDLPDPAELSRSTGLFLDISTTTPTGESVELPF
jgi:hypothetical protein